MEVRFIVEYPGEAEKIMEQYPEGKMERFTGRWAVVSLADTPGIFQAMEPGEIPLLYSPIPEAGSKEEWEAALRETKETWNISGIRREWKILGSGVFIGIVDTGVDYQSPGLSRGRGFTGVRAIWDQSKVSGPGEAPPEGYTYGVEYQEEQLEAAIAAGEPPLTTDPLQHGTAIALGAAGTEGLAPLAGIVAVKLRDAPAPLKEYYGVRESVAAYGEDDVLRGIQYVARKAREYGMPLVVILGLGNNLGDHEGSSKLGDYLTLVGTNNGIVFVCAGGEEGNAGHHARGIGRGKGQWQEQEFFLGEKVDHLVFSLWGNVVGTVGMEVISPEGESTGLISPRTGTFSASLGYAGTRIQVRQQVQEERTGVQSALIHLYQPGEGIWRVKILEMGDRSGNYDLWLPFSSWIGAQVRFLRPDPEITLTEPSNTQLPITITAFDPGSGRIRATAGRGYTRQGRVKPEVAAPALGTVQGAACTGGILALFLEWGLVLGNRDHISTPEGKVFLLRGVGETRAGALLSSPNPIWGYGTINFASSLEGPL